MGLGSVRTSGFEGLCPEPLLGWCLRERQKQKKCFPFGSPLKPKGTLPKRHTQTAQNFCLPQREAKMGLVVVQTPYLAQEKCRFRNEGPVSQSAVGFFGVSPNATRLSRLRTQPSALRGTTQARALQPRGRGWFGPWGFVGGLAWCCNTQVPFCVRLCLYLLLLRMVLGIIGWVLNYLTAQMVAELPL